MKNRRKLILSTIASATSSTIIWTKPVVNTIVLPSHAVTTEQATVEVTAPTPETTEPAQTTTTAAPREVFSRNFSNGEGLFGLNSALRVVAENGAFSIEYYSDAAESDLTAFIERGTTSSLNVSVSMSRSVCTDDGSEIPSSGMSTLTLSNYIPGVSIDVSSFSLSRTLPLTMNAPELSCPVMS